MGQLLHPCEERQHVPHAAVILDLRFEVRSTCEQRTHFSGITLLRSIHERRHVVLVADEAGCRGREAARQAHLLDLRLGQDSGFDLLRTETDQASATVTELKFRINVNNFAHEAAKSLEMNEVGLCNLSMTKPLVFDPYGANAETGSFILIDRFTNGTVGAGMIHFSLRRAQNVHWQALEVGREQHAALKGQKPAVLWFTGLSGAGKSTIANLVEKRLVALGRHTFLLDGDNVRHGLNRDLGFTDADRIENIRRIGEVARLMADAGLIVLTAFISPFRAEREMVRKMLPDGEFIEIFVDTTIEEAERRDPKGLYAKARAGEIKNFTGIDSPYEPPESPEIRIDTSAMTPDEAADFIITKLIP